MTTKQYLEQIERLNKMIDNKLVEIRDTKDRLYSVSVPTDKEKVQSSSPKDTIGEQVAKLVDLERETNELIEYFVDKKQSIIKQIDGLPKTKHYEILTLKYVQLKSFDEIKDKMDISESSMFSIFGSALKEFEKLYGDCYLKG